ncbi:MAG TPA: hypothetical protein V6D48_09210 [Oculatellaceae cyanobacterium]
MAILFSQTLAIAIAYETRGRSSQIRGEKLSRQACIQERFRLLL